MPRTRRHGTRVSAWVGWARGVLSLLAVAGLTVTILPHAEATAWWVRTLDFPRLQFLIAQAVLLGLLLALPRRLHWSSMVAGVVAATGVVWQAAVLFPYTPLSPVRMMAAGADCPSGNRLRVVAANVQMTDESAEPLFALLRRADPDVILLQETDAWWAQHLQALSGQWPHSAKQVTQNYFGMEILSKYPLVDPQVHFLTDSRNPSIFTGLALPSGTVVRFYGVHPRPPLAGQASTERDGQLLAAALAARQDGGPAVMAGDFNAVPWEGVLQHVERVGGLLSPRIGRDWVPTFRTGSLLMTWPLDHILAGPRFTLRTLEALPDFGSDHYPILAELCYAPEAAAHQPVPAARPGDIAAAQKTVTAAQNMAGPSPQPAAGKQAPGPASD
ncbi:endonuclease/exonuclease/phosphatase family protein [Teichococcus coralli]|nr:endonuclease/exonuclease/phosphatase family protein [Pseudoroseomonas coralli]